MAGIHKEGLNNPLVIHCLLQLQTDAFQGELKLATFNRNRDARIYFTGVWLCCGDKSGPDERNPVSIAA